MPSDKDPHPPTHREFPDYCQTISFTDANGVTKQLVFPKALDLDRPKRARTTFSGNQLERLEESFQGSQYLVGKDRLVLAHRLGLSETQVKVWFQNRRTKHKKDQEKKTQATDASAESRATKNVLRILEYKAPPTVPPVLPAANPAPFSAVCPFPPITINHNPNTNTSSMSPPINNNTLWNNNTTTIAADIGHATSRHSPPLSSTTTTIPYPHPIIESKRFALTTSQIAGDGLSGSNPGLPINTDSNPINLLQHSHKTGTRSITSSHTNFLLSPTSAPRSGNPHLSFPYDSHHHGGMAMFPRHPTTFTFGRAALAVRSPVSVPFDCHTVHYPPSVADVHRHSHHYSITPAFPYAKEGPPIPTSAYPTNHPPVRRIHSVPLS